MLCASPVSAQRRAFDLTTPRPIAAADKVWIEELTWMEIRDAMKAGKTTALIVAGSTEQNGPYVPTGKHVFVLRATAEAIARKLGNALIAPAIPFEPGNFSTTPGTIQVRDSTYDALIEDQAESLKANGFKHIILIGDSGGNQRGLDRVATKLSAAWAGSGTDHPLHQGVLRQLDGRRRRLAVARDPQDDGRRDSRRLQRQQHHRHGRSGEDSAASSGRTPARRRSTGRRSCRSRRRIANGRKLVEIRANITVEAIKKALAAK